MILSTFWGDFLWVYFLLFFLYLNQEPISPVPYLTELSLLEKCPVIVIQGYQQRGVYTIYLILFLNKLFHDNVNLNLSCPV